MRFWKSVLLTGLPFGFFMGIYWAIVDQLQVLPAILAAAGSGLLFGVFFSAWIRIFMKSQRMKHAATPIFFPEEQILKEGPANHFRGWEGVGGMLFLTTQRVVFKSHRLNIQRHELSIPFEQIIDAQPVMTAYISPTGLQLHTTTGRYERFVVFEQEREAWAAAIMAEVAKHKA